MRYAYVVVGIIILILIVGLAFMLARRNGGVVAYDTYGAPQNAYQASVLPAVNNDNMIIRGQYPVVSATTPTYQQPVYTQSPVYSTAVPAYVGYMPMTPMVWYNAPTQSSIVYGSSLPTTRNVVYGQPSAYDYNYQYQYSNVYQQPPQTQVYSYSYGSNTNAVNPSYYYNPANGTNSQWSGTWYSTPGYR